MSNQEGSHKLRRQKQLRCPCLVAYDQSYLYVFSSQERYALLLKVLPPKIHEDQTLLVMEDARRRGAA